MQGWIKLHRQFLDNPISENIYYGYLWIILLLNANYKPTSFVWNNKKITLQPGQLITSREKLAKIIKISETTIERILKYFENEQQIEQQKTNKFRIITIKNWEKYQSDENDGQQNGQQKDNKKTTNGQQTDNKKTHTRIYKNIKEEKEEKEGKEKDFKEKKEKEKKEIFEKIAATAAGEPPEEQEAYFRTKEEFIKYHIEYPEILPEGMAAMKKLYPIEYNEIASERNKLYNEKWELAKL